MRPETAAAFCGERSVEAFLAKVPKKYPAGYEIQPGDIRWLLDDFIEAREIAATSRTVYFLQAETTKLVKIGVTSNLAHRLYDLQAASPEKLTVIATLDGDLSLEKSFHRVLKAHRSHGEWFRPGSWVEIVLKAVEAKTYSWAILNELEAWAA